MAHKAAFCWVDKNHWTNYSEFPALQSFKPSKEIMVSNSVDLCSFMRFISSPDFVSVDMDASCKVWIQIF